MLLRALAERDPDLRRTYTSVAELAEATARRLGLAADEVERVRHAAELHDVGKVADPRRDPRQARPADEEEWGFVRRHPLIGERIVAARPRAGAGRPLVRSSHERWDGTGYPDRLAGERSRSARASSPSPTPSPR